MYCRFEPELQCIEQIMYDEVFKVVDPLTIEDLRNIRIAKTIHYSPHRSGVLDLHGQREDMCTMSPPGHGSKVENLLL